jgi:hypothetical protein
MVKVKKVRIKSEDKKIEAEYERKVAEIKADVRKRQPQMRFVIPELPAKIGTLEFDHMVHPFKPNSRRPLDLIVSPDRAQAELKKKLEIAKEKKKELAARAARNKSGDSDDDSDGDDSYGGTFLDKKKKKNERFEDFVIPNIIDAETGEECKLTKATWSTDEGRINEDMSSQIARGTGSLKIKNRPDSSHRIVPILSPRVIKKNRFQKAGTKVKLALAFKTAKNTTDNDPMEEFDTYDANFETHSDQNSGSNTHEDTTTSMLYKLKRQKNKKTIDTKKHHYYDETTEKITDDSAEYWRHDNSLHSVHKFEHFERGFTKEELAEKEHFNTLHKLHLNFKGGLGFTEGSNGGNTTSDADGLPGIHMHHSHEHLTEKQKVHIAAHKKMHPLVANFLKDGPQQPMYHKFWDKRVDKVVLPDNYINDEDGDADGYLSHEEDEKSAVSPRNGIVGTDNIASARSTTSSVGFDSIESIIKDKSHPDNQERPGSKAGALSVELEKAKQGSTLNKEEDADNSAVSILSDALDPDNEVSWKALEDRYYYEIRNEALDYEANKSWTKEKQTKGGVGGMDIAIRSYANWKMRNMKFIVQAIDDEEKKEIARLALEDELEINKPERLLDQVRIHNEERHKHRTYIKTFKYDFEILSLRKLHELGLVW